MGDNSRNDWHTALAKGRGGGPDAVFTLEKGEVSSGLRAGAKQGWLGLSFGGSQEDTAPPFGAVPCSVE